MGGVPTLMPGGEVMHSRREMVVWGVQMWDRRETVDSGSPGGRLGAGEVGRGVI